MGGRRSVWINEEVRELTGQFVLAADEVWRLQGGRDPKTYLAAGGNDPECLCFQDMAGKGHYGPGAGTKQGIYVCTPAGKFLSSVNSSSPEKVKAMMQRGLHAWQQLSDDERQQQPTLKRPAHRWEWSYPADGLVLKETIRYLADAPDADRQSNLPFNFDFAWFSAEEAKGFLPASPETGQSYELPEQLYQRFARLHLLNTARGESGIYHANELSGGLIGEVISLNQQVVTIRIHGNSRAKAQTEHDAHWRARRIEAQLLGFARFDRDEQRFIEFELVALGRLFRKADDEDREGQAIGWYFSLADPDDPTERISPTHLYGYRGDWVIKPGFELHDVPLDPSDAEKMKNDR